jgi:sarcosine oxidase subunit gamma
MGEGRPPLLQRHRPALHLPAVGDPAGPRLELLAPRARFVLRADPARLPTAGSIAAFALGMAINRRTEVGERVALRLGPDEWLLLAPAAGARTIAEEIAGALAGLDHALVDVGHAAIGFAIRGQGGDQILNRGCPLDLSLAAFATGHATRTLFGQCEIVLSRTEAGATFELECGRSYASYVALLLGAFAPLAP